MIGVSAKIFDLIGNRLFLRTDAQAIADNLSGSRRVSRTKTLDGGVLINDTGYTDADRAIDITEQNATAEAIEFVKHMIETYNDILVCTNEGAFSAAPEAWRVDARGTLHLRVLITAEESE